ncbi:MAG TPA: chromosome segregation protein SMC [Vicinamibacterales bacterium]|nr:chromosome segregation protein SMC [Vicinamibacterales bacterium]
MRLERLELSGFKSFSDRSELAFDEGVTAIVGPNGCGKSNVADALTWVLGEQSAKSLRGEKMEDVIFSGSDARKPTGAAEVRLKLSGVVVPPSLEKEMGYEPSTNGHHAEPNGHALDPIDHLTRDVEVTRRLFRSGESEYLIDGHLCRLKDIHELLMDTGLGAKAYAIIEQGKIGMILSSRPADRRQLIEEAAGITKYKARRRAAELKLEAAQQNLTRLDDIVFEVEKQKGALKRQAAKARRYTRLRDEMRRWEKVLVARRYRALAEAIESTRGRLAEAREHETAAAARLAEVESGLAVLRIEQAEADATANRRRDAAHARELDINRRQQQIALDRQQAAMVETRAAELDQERQQLEARREPERLALEGRRQAVLDAQAQRDAAQGAVQAAAGEYAKAQQAIDAVEQDVERARADVYAVVNTVTALNAAVQSAGAQRERAVEGEQRFAMESRELDAELDRIRVERVSSSEQLRRAQDGLDSARVARAARESELASAQIEHEWRAREVRAREQELAGMAARLRSLEELDAHRAGFADAARMVLVSANGKVGQMGALADFLEVEPRYERAVEACLGDLLQHVLVERLEHVSAGLRLIRQEDAGRCGFIVANPDLAEAQSTAGQSAEVPAGAVRLQDVVRVEGPFAGALRAAIGEAWIAESFDTASHVAPSVPFPVATLDGDVFRGRHVVTGGDKAEARGILATKREIKELRERIASQHAELGRLADETTRFEQTIAQATAAIQSLGAEVHRQEKAIVSFDAQVARAAQDESRVQQRVDLVAAEIRRVREEIAGLDARQVEAGESIARLDADKQEADDAFGVAVQRLSAAREQAEAASRTVAEARAEHATLVERCNAAAAEVARMAAAAVELERRVEACVRDIALMRDQRERLITGVTDHETALDADVRTLDELREEVRIADERAAELRAGVEGQEAVIRDARRALDATRALAAELDVARATAESDLAHLAQQALDAVGVSLDEVREDVERMEAEGIVEPDARAIRAAEAAEPDEEEGAVPAETADAPVPEHMTAEEAIAELRGKIDRIGPVNMMAIEQHSELEQRHTFLTTQRQDLIESIAQTNEAIERIDETTHVRFREAFTAINANFQQTFATLFGGGRAGISLLDETDPLESGIDIVASPPGKRLQSVMLLSGGEKALTAIALMFAIFRYKPSPFCLLDEIDAPLDDANIGRFVELLRGMMDKTQFIIITHSRKTMEIADRLYGVTMEEPGVSKLISIQMN